MKVNIKPVLLSFLIALIGWMSYSIYARTQEELLWGARTLVLFLAFWTLVVVLFYPKNRLLGWSTLSGVLLGLGFPGWLPLPFLLFFGFVPLLQVVKKITEPSENQKVGSIFKYSFHTFLIWNILSTYWVANSSLVAGIFTLLANSLLMTFPFLAGQWTYKVLPRLGFAPLVSYWLAFEFLHFHWELNYPWLTLGNGFAQFPAVVQWYAYTGIFGGSLWILLVNLLIFKAIEIYRTHKSYRKTSILALVVTLLPILLSLVQYFTFEETGDKIEVIAVQPGYEPHYAEPNTSEANKLERCVELTTKYLDLNTDYLIFPEATFGYVEITQMSVYPPFERLNELVRDHPGLHIVTGASVYRVIQADEPNTEATRIARSQDGNSMRYEAYNAAVQLSTNAIEFPVHKKSRLVPGPESFPFKRILFFLKPLVEKMGGTTAGLGTDTIPMVFKSDKAMLAPMICYESVFGEYVASYVKSGAAALFIMTNDGWWDDTPGHWQHLYFASLRAIETRRSIARAANTGNSAFINQRGDIVEKTKYGEAAVIKSTLYLNQEQTFYVRWGDFLARISLFFTLLFVLASLWQGLRRLF